MRRKEIGAKKLMMIVSRGAEAKAKAEGRPSCVRSDGQSEGGDLGGASGGTDSCS